MSLRAKSPEPNVRRRVNGRFSHNSATESKENDGYRDNLLNPVKKGLHIHKRADAASSTAKSLPWLDRLLGPSTKCSHCDFAEVTTMEKRYSVHPRVAEFWCAITSPFYALGVFVYACPRERWAAEWQLLNHLPSYIHTSIALSVLLAISSAAYHALLWELLGSIDCSIAIIVWFAVTLSTFGAPLAHQALILVPLLVVFFFLWRRSTRMALLAGAVVFPLSICSCLAMRWPYGAASVACLCLGVICFLCDRLNIAPLHPLWHILSSMSLFISLWETVESGPVTKYFQGREFY